MWTTENRPRYERKGLRYPSDLTEAEWALCPAANSAGQTRWPQAGNRCPRGAERCDVYFECRLPMAGTAIEIVKRSDAAKGFEI